MCTIVFLFLFLNRNYNIEYAIVYYLCVCMRKNILELIIQLSNYPLFRAQRVNNFVKKHLHKNP